MRNTTSWKLKYVKRFRGIFIVQFSGSLIYQNQNDPTYKTLPTFTKIQFKSSFYFSKTIQKYNT